MFCKKYTKKSYAKYEDKLGVVILATKLTKRQTDIAGIILSILNFLNHFFETFNFFIGNVIT